MKPLAVDAVIVGGGIAGLWTLSHLLAAGRTACLLEKSALGAGQSVASQGIIHGGLKYALDGTLTQAARAIADMPARWREALAGGRPDLSAARQSTDSQLMWIPRGLGSRFLGLVAAKAGRADASRLDPSEWPDLFRHSPFKGQIVRHGEPVLDVPSVLGALRAVCDPFIRRLPEGGLQLERTGNGRYCAVIGDKLRLEAEKIVCMAGEGNAELIARAGAGNDVATQRRPLHMLMLRDAPGDLYAHCLGRGYSPKLTITTHYDRHGGRIWYIGGQIAEDGVDWDEQTLIAQGRERLATALPWLDFSACAFAGFRIARAEPKTRFGHRPDAPVVREWGNLLFAWPSKLAFAPALAETIGQRVGHAAALNREDLAAALKVLDVPDVATPPWEGAAWK